MLVDLNFEGKRVVVEGGGPEGYRKTVDFLDAGAKVLVVSQSFSSDMAIPKSSEIQMLQAYFHELLKQGVFIPPSQFETCFLSIVHAEEDVKATINAFDEALKSASKTKSGTV